MSRLSRFIVLELRFINLHYKLLNTELVPDFRTTEIVISKKVTFEELVMVKSLRRIGELHPFIEIDNCPRGGLSSNEIPCFN